MRTIKLADEQLIMRYQHTNASTCLEILYRRYVDKVYQQCLGLTNDDQDAQDYTQEIFLKVLSKLGTFQNRSKFSTWLYAVSHHYCVDQLRQKKRYFFTVVADDLNTGSAKAPEPMDGVAYQLEGLSLAMERLPVPEATLLRLKYEQGLSVQQIAAQYYLSNSAVKMRLKRSRAKLQELYQQVDL